MKLGRVIALPASLVLVVPLSCSDPPSPPAEAAITLSVTPTLGGTCPVASRASQFSVPADQNLEGPYQALGCNWDADPKCDPGEFVVVDGDSGASVECKVRSSGEQFEVNLKLSKGSVISFSAAGVLSASGGTLTLSERDNQTLTTLTDRGCIVEIVPNMITSFHSGVLKKGAIWAHFSCQEFADPGSPNAAGCRADGAFIFQNCSGG